MPPATPRPTPQRIEPPRMAAVPPATSEQPAEPVKPAPVIVWEEPAPIKVGRHAAPIVSDVVLAELRAQHGRWAKVKLYQSKSGATSAANSINGKKKRLGPGWEAASRTTGTGSALYLRAAATPKETA